jgi:6-phosphofructokinase 1
MRLRGGSFGQSFRLLRTLVGARPQPAPQGVRQRRIGLLHAGGPAPGMNTAVRVALRVTMARGHRVLAVRNGFRGLLGDNVENVDDIEELDWMSVSGWVSQPGAELGTSRRLPDESELDRVVETLQRHQLDGLLIVGGWAGYRGAHLVFDHAGRVGAGVPIMCVPATINNDLPATDLSIGADTALNSISSDIDKIKESAVASQRCFVVEVMGHDCGYLALMGGLATGAERVYLPEEGITLERLQDDLAELQAGFALGKRRGLVVRSEHADPLYTTHFVAALFEHESGGAFDVRGAILGHIQQGGSPSPFDRILATRLASAATTRLIDRLERDDTTSEIVGVQGGEVVFTPLAELPDLVEPDVQRTRGEPWWMALRPLADEMATARPNHSRR